MSKARAKPKTESIEAQERSIFVEQTRKRAFHCISHDVAAVAGLTMPQLQQFAMGWLTPSDAQIDSIAKRVGLA